ncbi:protein-export chaperone SecB [Xenorhabdus bovienii]|uniref:Protein-export chaperone SecB n=1 Tax=Xenorhabdus bovienii TaxID=40576 RepID=A0AAJ1JB33_XENBV|nr:protein-export chaperone SecB [Xenorhabdus bovienii]MDE1480499.1 protein-export chaperone SecB [Xenorhabdus bovienii]MDE9512182.1 protein-export chaperone SecB [Xenorhabdus bovienii]MDE9523843.1 protein-export chaperone SecB [Xenorhabdus bovienii]
MLLHLKSAQKKLQIVNVLIRDGYFSVNPEIKVTFMDKILSENKTKPQSYEAVTLAHELSTDDDENHAYVFDFDVSVRVVKIKESKDEDIDEKDVIYMINAQFEAFYTSKEKLTEEEIKAFSKNNVTYHAWPYWREFVQSACSRMGTQPLQIPMFKLK